MKKVYLLLSILVSLLIINVVEAKEPYKLEFSTEDKETLYAGGHLPYKDGYLFIDFNDATNMYTVTYYTNEGEAVKSKDFYDVREGVVMGNDVYAIIRKTENDSMVLAHFNENLEIVKEIAIPQPQSIDQDDLPTYISDYYYYLEERILVSGNKIKLTDYNVTLYTYDSNLTLEDSHQITESEINTLFPEIKTYNSLKDMENVYTRYHAFDKKGDKIVAARTVIKESCRVKSQAEATVLQDYCYITSVILYDKQLNVIWEKEIEGNRSVDEVKFTNDYITAVVNDYELKTTDSTSYYQAKKGNHLYIYDMNGNQIQTLESLKGFKHIVPSNKGFAVLEKSCESHQVFTSVLGASEEYNPIFDTEVIKKDRILNECTSSHQVYSVLLNINTKVTQGKGTIKVISASKPGEPVTFVVTPDEGYILGEVKVTDKNGKVVVFRQNTFTMPDSDVLVEATFLVKNAETKDIAITLVALLAVVTGGLALIQYRRIKTY